MAVISFSLKIAPDSIDGVYACELMIIDGNGALPKTAKTALSIILGAYTRYTSFTIV